ncbi:MAG: mycothiol synthase [Bifidobacteriaceae bacterium]|jgi:mycothiol synthase|nr:mycothiol synthase [Bifidobacteriaceae bacterium]
MTTPTEEPLARVVGEVSPATQRQVVALAERVKEYDGVEAISEAPLLALAAADPAVTHFLGWRNNQLAGYAQRSGDGAAAELAVDPAHRRRGIARAVIRLLAQDNPRTRLWAHGDMGASRQVAAALCLVPARELWQMTVDCRAGRADSSWTMPPPGSLPTTSVIASRQFEPDRDPAIWVELNALAFAGHPEQGSLTLEDFEQRMAQPWFDPAGLIFAGWPGDDRQSGQAAVPGVAGSGAAVPAGYVWTKIEAGIGEIYALAVHPAARGQRLGTHLLDVAMRHLEAQGVSEVRLFVEADNKPAIAAYHRQGFRTTRRDIQYAFRY